MNGIKIVFAGVKPIPPTKAPGPTSPGSKPLCPPSVVKKFIA